MRALLTALCIITLVGAAGAEKPPADPAQPGGRVPCDMDVVTYVWDFADGPQDFAPAICEAPGVAAWDYGDGGYVGHAGNVWGTVLAGDYPNESGDGLMSPAFMVTEASYLVEIYHYTDIENNYDGGNLEVNGVVVPPTDGYPATISTSTGFYAWCVDMEEGFTDDEAWGARCFDLGQFMGEEVVLSFDFGSDNSVTYPGWYIASVTVGGTDPSANDGTTWGEIKGLFH